MSLGLQTAGLMDKVTGKASAWFQGWLQKVDNALIITGTLTDGNIIVSDGGNNVSDGGPVPVGTVTHTGALTDHAVIVGNGAADISALASLGTTTTVLHGNAAADPTFGPVVEADITLANNTTNNVSIARHGFTPILPNDATKFLNGVGAYAVPPGTGTGTVTHTGALTANKAIIGNGTDDVTISAATGVAHLASGTLTGSNVVESEITLANNTTNDVSITKHGFTPILPNDATRYLDGTGAYSVPAGSGGGTVTNTGTLTANKAIIGNGGSDVTASALTGIIKQTAGVQAVATVNTDYLAPAAYMVCGRLTTESGVPISTADRTAQGTIYWTPYGGDTVPLYTGSAWVRVAFSEISLALSGLTSGKNYDVFLYNNAGTVTIELSAAWTTNTARADAVSLQNGLYVKTSATTRLLVGTIRTTGTATTADAALHRFVWNTYNRVDRFLSVVDTTASWTWNSATWHQANASAANQVDYVVGLSEDMVRANVLGQTDGGIGKAGAFGIGIDVTNANSAQLLSEANSGVNSGNWPANAAYLGYPGIGYHFIAWIEYARAGTVTFQGTSGVADQQTGMHASVKQ